MKKRKSLLLSIGICVVSAVIGGLLAGDSLENWFMKLTQPWFSPPLWGWYIVAALYYMMSVTILYRLFNASREASRTIATSLTLIMIAGNEFWNYLFFGLESTFIAFVALIPFTILVIMLFIKLWNYQRATAWILLPYLIWLGYDLIWTYNLWLLNQEQRGL